MLQNRKEKNQIGFVGLGKMGGAMVEKLLAQGFQAVVFDQSKSLIQDLAAKGAEGAMSLNELAQKLNAPKIIWMMIPAGQPLDQVLAELDPLLSSGDILVDGGNSHYKDSMRRAGKFKERGVYFLDIGTSGGIWGRENGYCLMVGGENAAYKSMEKVFAALAPKEGCRHVGPSGAGHYVKMVHNAIEYGMLQACGEGFELMQVSDFELNPGEIAELWNQGSVVRSWILELCGKMFQEDPGLASLQPYVEDSGEGRWAVQEAIEKNISTPVIALSLLERLRSRTKESFSAKVIAGLRRQFGGHSVLKK